MFVLDRRKMFPEGGDGGGGAGAGDNPNPAEGGSAPGSEGSAGGSGNKGEYVHRDVLNRYKDDLGKAKEKLKAANSELEEFRTNKATQEEQKLLEDKNFEEVLARRDADITGLKEQNQQLQGKIDEYGQREQIGAKLDAFMSHADFKVDKQYMMHIDLDSIKMDEQGEILSSTVKSAVDKFRNEHSQLISTGRKGPRGQQPGNSLNSKMLTRQEYFELYRRDQKAAIQASNRGLVAD